MALSARSLCLWLREWDVLKKPFVMCFVNVAGIVVVVVVVVVVVHGIIIRFVLFDVVLPFFLVY